MSIALECSLRIYIFHLCIRETVTVDLGAWGLYSQERETEDMDH